MAPYACISVFGELKSLTGGAQEELDGLSLRGSSVQAGCVQQVRTQMSSFRGHVACREVRAEGARHGAMRCFITSSSWR